MDDTDRMLYAAILKALKAAGAAGFPAELIWEHVQRACEVFLSAQERGDLLEYLEQKEKWIQSYRHPITKQVRYSITAAGVSALMSL